MTTIPPALLPLSTERLDSISLLIYRELRPALADLLSEAGLDVLEAGPAPLVLEPGTGLYGVLPPESAQAWHSLQLFTETEVCEFAEESIALLDWARTPAEAEALLPPGAEPSPPTATHPRRGCGAPAHCTPGR